LELSKTILAPVAAQLGSKRLIIVADGALQYIPFSMLPDPAAGMNQPLVVGHEVVSLPSASTLVFQRKELAGRQAAPKMLAVFAANKPRFTPDPKKPYAHPYYWAPFILIGNWK
jgi:CHAT domain-containing protein